MSPKNRLKRMQQGGGICPQILRISHEYRIEAFKIVKKNQLVTGQKLSLDKNSGRNTKQNVHHHKISPKKWHDKSTRQKNQKKKQRTSQNQKKTQNQQPPKSKIQNPLILTSLGGYVPYIYCHDKFINNGTPVPNSRKNVWPPFPRRQNGTTVKMYGVLSGTPPWLYISWGVGMNCGVCAGTAVQVHFLFELECKCSTYCDLVCVKI